MFIPRGKPLHENLFTSYVMVEALVADLCEGGFSGVVEVALRDADGHIIISRGRVAATVGTRQGGEPSVLDDTAVREIASRAKVERGRISVYSYSLATAEAIAGRLRSQVLYSRLSTEFADLEKMLSRLDRELDRQWFIELESESGFAALIHIDVDRCWINTSDSSRSEFEVQRSELMRDSQVREILDDFNRVGGTFDVYYAAGEHSESELAQQAWIEPPGLIRARLASGADNASVSQKEPPEEISRAVLAAKAALHSLSPDPGFPNPTEGSIAPHESMREPDAPTAEELEEARFMVLGQPREPEAEDRLAKGAEAFASLAQETGGFVFEDLDATGGLVSDADELLQVGADFKAAVDAQRAGDAEVMAEVKRLMSEIARTIENALQSVELRSTFPIHLRAGQLKIAERYPFLDPFGTEFEYLAGEIEFVGRASPAEFVEGLTEALKLAVDGIAQTSPQPSGVRSKVSEALRWLLSRQQTELESYGLDESIERIIRD